MNEEILYNEIFLEYPSILYKYRVWEDTFHQRILYDNSVFLASPNSFEDTNDCNVPESFPSSQKDLYNAFLEKSKKENIGYSEDQHFQYAMKWSIESPLANIEYRDNLLKQLKNEFDNRYGILSLTTNSHSDEMWHKYGNNHKGICIGFDTQKLFDVVGGGGPVRYYDTLPAIDFFNDDFQTKHIKNILSKEAQWAFEEEYRLHKMWEYDVRLPDRNILLPKDCIVKVILGGQISNTSKDAIISVLQSKHPNVLIEEEKT